MLKRCTRSPVGDAHGALILGDRVAQGAKHGQGRAHGAEGREAGAEDEGGGEDDGDTLERVGDGEADGGDLVEGQESDLVGHVDVPGGKGWPAKGADPEAFAAVFDVVLQGAIRMAQACLPAMRSAGGGSIVNVSTQSTVKPFPGEAMYGAAKGALNSATRHMATDFGAYGVRVNCLRMGWIGGAPVYAYIDQQVAAGADRSAVIGSITERIPLGIIPPEDDCARAVLTFLSDHTRVITGASVDVNGGEYMAP